MIKKNLTLGRVFVTQPKVSSYTKVTTKKSIGPQDESNFLI
jgi:hypothetical protein